MSTKPKQLTALQEEIIDVLANDYENLQQIQGMLDHPVPIDEIESALWALIEEGYVACYQPTKTEMKPVAHPNRQQLDIYWFALTEKGEQILEKWLQQQPIDKYPKLKPHYEALKEQMQVHFHIAEQMLKADCGNLYPSDMLILAILKRSLDLLDGVLCLVDRWNFASAAPLLRLQIDSLLKLFYIAQQQDGKHAFEVFKAVLEGKRFDQLRDPSGQRLTDKRLREYAKGSYPWLDKVYEETSKMIHLSGKHIFLSHEPIDEKNRIMRYALQVGYPNWPQSEIDKFLQAFIHTTDALLQLAREWINRKQNLKHS